MGFEKNQSISKSQTLKKKHFFLITTLFTKCSPNLHKHNKPCCIEDIL